MFKDLAERQVDERIYESLISYIWESVNLGLDKVNTIRLLSPFLKTE